MSEVRLRYGALLLTLLWRELRIRTVTDWPRVNDLCDRFERLMATAREPLLWEGDYA